MFTEAQEEWLGEIIDQSIRKEFHVLKDPEDRLQQLGERLLAQLPPTQVHYRFVIVDSPELNSFGIAGGRIFIFRRTIAFTQNEDELAMLLAHEIGHIITHQSAIETTRSFRELGITQVGDRQDILNKWNQFADNAAKLHSRRDEEEDDQLIADRIGMYAMARAGYDPARGVDFLDRLLLTKGKMGGFWSDFLGHTRPTNIRLRELVRDAASLPPSCISRSPESRNTFLQWRDEIIGTSRVAAREDVPGLISKTALEPAFRSELDQVQFSPDGSYLLAQDESSIFVMKLNPLTNLFRIDAANAYLGQFTPDSASIVFYDRELRVGKWDVQTKQRAWIHELNASRCWGSALSPTGDVLACVRPRLEVADPVFELQLINVATGQPFFVREKFYQLSRFELFSLYLLLGVEDNPSLFTVRFSPDGRYVVVARETTSLAYDLQEHQEVKLPLSLKEAIASSFTFIASDRVAGFNRWKGRVAQIEFPSGHTKEDFAFARAPLSFWAAQKGDYVVVRGNSNPPIAVLSLKEKKLITGYKAPAFAIYDPLFAGEANTGEVMLGTLADNKLTDKINLPHAPLGALRVAAFSPDGKWLAVSSRSRGAIWNLDNGERVFHTKNFDGAFFDPAGQIIMQFPQQETSAEAVFQFDLATQSTKKLYDLALNQTEADKAPVFGHHNLHSNTMQEGDLLFKLTPKSGAWYNQDYALEVRDVRTNNLLWQRKFEREKPEFHYSQGAKTLTLVLANYTNIKEAIKDNHALQAKLEAVDAKKDSYLIQSFNPATGQPLGAVLVDTGKLSFRVESALTADDTVVVQDSINRTLVYSLKSGQQRGKVFGQLRAVSKNGAKLLVENGTGVADVYDSNSMQSICHFVLPAGIIGATFASDNENILLLTANQIVYKIKPTDQP